MDYFNIFVKILNKYKRSFRVTVIFDLKERKALCLFIYAIRNILI